MSNQQTFTARVTAVYRGHVEVSADSKTYEAKVRGLFHEKPKNEWPKVGDWVECSTAYQQEVVIEAVSPRKNSITRHLSFDDTTQVMVTNIDWLCIVMGLDNDYNPRRLKRYLALAETSGVNPIVVLSKVDIAEDVERAVAEVTALAPEVPVYVVSSKTGEGVEKVRAHLGGGQTLVLLGSSGAGKSSLTNALLGMEAEATGRVRARDDRGRHTTTRRQLYQLPNGAAIIDTPGLRELAMTDEEESADAAYPELAVLALECRFNDCDHVHSAGCALRAAVVAGDITEADVEAYLKLKLRQERHRRTRSSRPRS